jgi:hypothetical protein
VYRRRSFIRSGVRHGYRVALSRFRFDQTIGEFSEVGVGGVLLGWLQGEQQLPAGVEAAGFDLGDIIRVCSRTACSSWGG